MISVLHDGLTQIQFDIQNVHLYIETLHIVYQHYQQCIKKSPKIYSTWFDIKDQLRSYLISYKRPIEIIPMVFLPANISSNIWSYYKFLKIQAFVLTDMICHFGYILVR